LAACHVSPPPPVLPFHTTTEPDPKGETSLVLVVGGVMQGLGGAGLGVAVRLQHQQTDHTALGLEMAAGHGDGDNTKLSMVAFRGYGRTTVRDYDWLAVTYGAGFSLLSTGMVSVTAHAGTATSYPNDHFVPYLSVSIAVAAPLTQGDDFGDMDDDINESARANAAVGSPPIGYGGKRGVGTTGYLVFDPGFLVPAGDTGHDFSFDLGLAFGTRSGTGFWSASIADQVHQ
ncbi:MAG: hypothetical protein ABI175_28250, partial [Polyangiales bacterium]